MTGITGLAGADTQTLSATGIPYYTTASGTSFSAPQVARHDALMLEANPNLSPAEVKDILSSARRRCRNTSTTRRVPGC